MRLFTVGLLSTLALGLLWMPLLQILPGFGGMRLPVLVIDFASDDSMRPTLVHRRPWYSRGAWSTRHSLSAGQGE
jgi:hypothetical protein